MKQEEKEREREGKRKWKFPHLSVPKKLNTFPSLFTLSLPLSLSLSLSSDSSLQDLEREREKVSTESVRCQVVRKPVPSTRKIFIRCNFDISPFHFLFHSLTLTLSLSTLFLSFSLSHPTSDWGKEEKSERTFLVTVLDPSLLFLF